MANTCKGNPITSPELKNLRDRLLGQANKGIKGILFVRLAIDCDHLSMVMDREDSLKQGINWAVRIKKAKAKGGKQK